MNRIYVFCTVAVMLLFLPVNAQVRVFTLGDSTMADYDEVKKSEDKEMRGWGQMLPMFLSDSVALHNVARNGRSSKSFYFEFWGNLRGGLQSGDYVFIQFGHNDEKNNGKDTDESDTKERGTAPWGQFQKYLRKYIVESREKGAVPVLVTPVVRRMFNSDGKTLSERGKHNLVEYSEVKNDSVLNYVMAMKSVAHELNVPLINMTALTQQLVESYGPDKSKQVIFCKEDNTHLKGTGGMLFSKLFVDELIKQNILTEYIKYPAEVVIGPNKLDFGSQLVTTPIAKAISIGGIGLSAGQKIEVTVDKPFQVSLYPDRGYSQSLSVETTGDYYKSVFVRFLPTEAIVYGQPLRLLVDSKSKDIPLSGIGIAADKNKAVTVSLSFPKEASTNGVRPIVEGNIVADVNLVGLVKTMGYKLTTLDGKWSKQEIDINSSRYIELSLTATSYNVYINHISYSLQAGEGDKMQFTALGSLDPDFVKTDSYAVMESMSSKNLKSYSFDTMISIPKGSTYRLRIYPWDRAGEKNFMVIDNILMKGLGK
ncbi:MAG: rhamnogalacturonan acetylesterase [Dysgonomonas sp.]|nr:rhamnogalacturonan acetylesterase [Dysgonomonas sp.]